MMHLSLPLIPAPFQTALWVLVILSAVVAFVAKTMQVLAAQVKPCPACRQYAPVKAKQCPHCGASFNQD